MSSRDSDDQTDSRTVGDRPLVSDRGAGTGDRSADPGREGSDKSLVCPVCATRHLGTERFCQRCGIPLVFVGSERSVSVSPAHAHARKIKPQLADGPLVRVAGARNQVEAEFIQGLLLEEGVPSVLRRSRGFDVPDFLAAGPRDVLVPASGAPTASEVLLQADLAPTGDPPPLPAARLAVGLLLSAGVVAVVAWAVTQVA